MGKYSKSLIPVLAALGAILADVGLISADLVGEFTSSIVTLLAVFGVVLTPANNYDKKW